MNVKVMDCAQSLDGQIDGKMEGQMEGRMELQNYMPPKNIFWQGA